MNKACPVVTKSVNGSEFLLCFTHPIAGNQIVKGTIEEGEGLNTACIRELREEAGIVASVSRDLGIWNSGYNGQVWGMCLMEVRADLPETWEFFTEDDGGRLFKFFWHPLSCKLPGAGHAVFERARAFIARALTSGSI